MGHLVRSVLHIITGLRDGGAEAVLYRLCTQDLGNRHHVMSLGDGGKYGTLLAEAGIPVTCLNMPSGRVTYAGMRKMWRTMRDIRPSVVQTWMYHANLLGGIVARLSGQRNICWGIRHSTLHSGQVSRSAILAARISAQLSGWIPRLIICCAEEARRAHVAMGYDPARVVVIPNGFNFSRFQPDVTAGEALRAEVGIAPSHRVIGFVARCHPLKDHANLLQALVLLRDCAVRPICLLVGSGMDRHNTELTDLIDGLGLTDQVRLLGPRGDIPAVMNALDLHVMSSMGEGFPNVLAEAMACGTPCVSTDVGDAAEILGGTGRIVPPRDPAALAEAISYMLSEREGPAWPDRQEAAHQHITVNFSMDLMLDSYRSAWFDRDAVERRSAHSVNAETR